MCDKENKVVDFNAIEQVQKELSRLKYLVNDKII